MSVETDSRSRHESQDKTETNRRHQDQELVYFHGLRDEMRDRFDQGERLTDQEYRLAFPQDFLPRERPTDPEEEFAQQFDWSILASDERIDDDGDRVEMHVYQVPVGLYRESFDVARPDLLLANFQLGARKVGYSIVSVIPLQVVFTDTDTGERHAVDAIQCAVERPVPTPSSSPHNPRR